MQTALSQWKGQDQALMRMFFSTRTAFFKSFRFSQHGRESPSTGRSPARSFAWMKPLGLVLLGAAGATYLLRKWETPRHAMSRWIFDKDKLHTLDRSLQYTLLLWVPGLSWLFSAELDGCHDSYFPGIKSALILHQSQSMTREISMNVSFSWCQVLHWFLIRFDLESLNSCWKHGRLKKITMFVAWCQPPVQCSKGSWLLHGAGVLKHAPQNKGTQ